jgi:hypothetical protein
LLELVDPRPHALSLMGDGFYVGGVYRANTTIGTTSLVNQGETDLFITRINASNHVEWVVGGGGNQWDVVQAIATARDGGVYACVETSEQLVLGGQAVGEAGRDSGSLLKLSASGDTEWSVTLKQPDANGPAYFYDVGVARNGDVIAAGTYYSEPVTISGDSLSLEGASGAFMARFTAAGELVKVLRIGGVGSPAVGALTLLGDDIVIAGGFSGTADFDVNGPGGEVTAAGGNDAVIARYAPNGSLAWVRAFGGLGEEGILSVCSIGTGHLVISGYFNPTIQLGLQTLHSLGYSDSFLARLNAQGNVESAGQLGSEYHDYLPASVVSDGNVAIAVGSAQGEYRFPDGTRRKTFGIADAFIFQQP